MLRHMKIFTHTPHVHTEEKQNETKTLRSQLHRGEVLRADTLDLSKITIHRGRAGRPTSEFRV